MDLNHLSAYHGTGWKPRTDSLEDEIRRGDVWCPYQCDAEWGRLRAVQIYLPSLAISEVRDPHAVLHLSSIDYERLCSQFAGIWHVFERLDVKVHVVPQRLVDDRRHPNAMFQRDLFWQTRQGAVVARMASPVRAGEEVYGSQVLSGLRVPIALTVAGRGTFEGADCLWANPNAVFCGIGARTNEAGFEQIRDLLRRQGVRCIPLPVPRHVQHLLGCVQILSPTRALVRGDVVDPELVRGLREGGLLPILIPDTQEITDRQAFNFVVLDKDTVVMSQEAPRFQDVLKGHDVTVAACAPISELTKAAGGLACATGILHRESVSTK